MGNRADGLETYYHVAMGVYWHFVIFQVCWLETFDRMRVREAGGGGKDARRAFEGQIGVLESRINDGG